MLLCYVYYCCSKCTWSYKVFKKKFVVPAECNEQRMLNERHYCTGDVQHNNAYGTGSSTHVLSGFDDLYPLQIIIDQGVQWS